jgi:hypothetical protein
VSLPQSEEVEHEEHTPPSHSPLPHGVLLLTGMEWALPPEQPSHVHGLPSSGGWRLLSATWTHVLYGSGQSSAVHGFMSSQAFALSQGTTHTLPSQTPVIAPS